VKVYLVVTDDGRPLAIFTDEAIAEKYADCGAWRSVIEMKIDAEVARMEVTA
jgi:hypothetical protein